MSDQQSKLAKILEAHRGERHLIVLHDFPDPDAISAGFAHQLISGGYEIETDIMYNGRISHQQNIAMVRMLAIRLQRFDPEWDFGQYQGAVFVDNQGANAGKLADALETAGVPPLIIVDHHEQQERLSPEFSDIRPEAGSSATIYTEYLEQGVFTLDKSVRDHVTAATALLLGIKTDTMDLTRARAEDFHAAAYLSTFSDADLLSQIMSQSRSRQVMEVIRMALENRVIAESYSIAGIGYLRSEDRDAIPQVADFLLTEENIHTVIVYGIVRNDEGEELLVGSLRTSKITIDPDAFIKETFGTDASGQYFGGGKMSAGAFEIPVGFLAGENTNADYQQLKWQVYDLQVKQSIFSKTGIKQE
jgi:nanoRNase/pAp phosphatase (c-di-AMP/oligoRNAs hydrolase)